MRVFRTIGSAAAALFVLAGCAVVPEALRPVPDGQPAVADVQAAPDAWVGAAVVWGGVVAVIVNRSDHTLIEVVARPLDSSRRPQAADRSEGRFRAEFSGFLDPQVYATGREVTVRGEVLGVIEDKIGEFRYGFPRVRASAVHLWPEPEPMVQCPPDPFWNPWWPHYRNPWHPGRPANPWCRW